MKSTSSQSTSRKSLPFHLSGNHIARIVLFESLILLRILKGTTGLSGWQIHRYSGELYGTILINRCYLQLPKKRLWWLRFHATANSGTLLYIPETRYRAYRFPRTLGLHRQTITLEYVAKQQNVRTVNQIVRFVPVSNTGAWRCLKRRVLEFTSNSGICQGCPVLPDPFNYAKDEMIYRALSNFRRLQLSQYFCPTDLEFIDHEGWYLNPRVLVWR